MALPWVPERREVIWIDCNPQAGREMRDLHPMLVLSPQAFNERTSIVIGLPMTSAESNDDNPFAVKVTGPKGVASYILCHQPKSFDWRARKAKLHPWKQLPTEVFAAACARLNQIIAVCE
jgi:mRNA interferase MazF